MPAPFNPVARLKAWAYMRQKREFDVIEMREAIGMSQKTAWKLMRVYALGGLVEVAVNGRKQKPDIYRVIRDVPLPAEILDTPLDASVMAGQIVKRQIRPRAPKPPRIRKPRAPKMPKPTPKVTNPGMGAWLRVDGTRHNPKYEFKVNYARCSAPRCHEATCYRKLDAPTLKGWVRVGDEWVCPKCAAELDSTPRKS